MTSADNASKLLADLARVEDERRIRASDPWLAERVLEVKRFQHQRFEKTYSDLLVSPRYASAAHFFLDELYGPHDFTDRDAQFARVVPALVKLFPDEIVVTVGQLGALHRLAEELDSAMGARLQSLPLDGPTYVRAWQAVGRENDRVRQVRLMLAVGHDLDRLTRRRALRQTLRLMRVPAKVARLELLQSFLEAGFDTFAGLGGAAEFLGIIEMRELSLIDALFRTPDAASRLLATPGMDLR